MDLLTFGLQLEWSGWLAVTEVDRWVDLIDRWLIDMKFLRSLEHCWLLVWPVPHQVQLLKREALSGQYLWTGVVTAAPDNLALPDNAGQWTSAAVVINKSSVYVNGKRVSLMSPIFTRCYPVRVCVCVRACVRACVRVCVCVCVLCCSPHPEQT